MSGETMNSYDVAAAEIYVGSVDRIQETFKQIAHSLGGHLTSVGCKEPNYRGVPEADGSLIWDWSYFPSPPAPRGDWFVGWGLRFPARSRWWNNLDPPMPNVTHAFVCFGSDGKKDKPRIGGLPEQLIPLGWARDPDDDQMVIGKPLGQLNTGSRELPVALVDWMGHEIDNLKPILGKLLKQYTTQ